MFFFFLIKLAKIFDTLKFSEFLQNLIFWPIYQNIWDIGILSFFFLHPICSKTLIQPILLFISFAIPTVFVFYIIFYW